MKLEPYMHHLKDQQIHEKDFEKAQVFTADLGENRMPYQEHGYGKTSNLSLIREEFERGSHHRCS